MQEKVAPSSFATAGVISRPGLVEAIEAPHFTYNLTCIGADGAVKWEEVIHNLVTTVGRNNLLDVYFRAQTAPGNWFIGLIGSATAPVAGDTMASKGWTESAAYTEATRPALTFGAASSGSVVATAADFSINTNSTTIHGCFAVNNSTKSGTTGILYSAGAFSGGSRTLNSGDTLKVTLTLSINAV